MHVTVGYLISKPEDFKICTRCRSLNWYENESCVNCGNGRFRRATEKDVAAYVKARERDEHFCEECEVDV